MIALAVLALAGAVLAHAALCSSPEWAERVRMGVLGTAAILLAVGTAGTLTAALIRAG